jgi:uncharacterized OB-fold protein
MSEAKRARVPRRPRPGINRDNSFFWEGLKEDKLLIQRCQPCGELRHPPGPMCPHCHSLEWDTLEACGRGTIYSYVNLHHPAVPPFANPNPIGLIELEEGTRLVAGLLDIEADEVRIGQPVEVMFYREQEDDDHTIALFRVTDKSAEAA